MRGLASPRDRLCGAWRRTLPPLGLSALYFASPLPKAKIVGIEPARDNVEMARKNTGQNPLIEIIEAAVHDAATTLEIVNPEVEKFTCRE